MRKIGSFLCAAIIAALMVASPVMYKRWLDREYHNFHVVEEGVLYRSGQLPLSRLQQIITDYRIRTVISLRDGIKDPRDQEEEKWVKAKALNFVRIPPRQWYPDSTGKIPADASVQTFRKIMDDPANYPVLVHCFAGFHRTGMMCALFRIDYQGWSKSDAMTEMRVLGYSILDDHEDIQSYLREYQPQAHRQPPAR